MASPQPSESQTSTFANDILVQQVRAFLEASEDVDIDVETVEDLMQTILPDYEQNDETPSRTSTSDLGGSDLEEDTALHDESLDVSVLYSIEDEAQETWTRHEMKEMLHHLKECGMTSWIKEYVVTRSIPIPRLLRAFGITLCEALRTKQHSTLLYFLKVAISRELRQRERLTQYNTITDAVNLIRSSNRILVLTGAGISVSCGIPDFRSRDGLYASLKDRGDYDLDDPQQMFDINYFKENPAVFYSFARFNRIYYHHPFIKLIEDKNQLLRNYTQNIDTLETLVGVKRVLQCHGSFATASCLRCRRRVIGSDIEADILKQKVPLCPICNPPVTTTATRKKKMSRKKAKGEWDSNDEDASDGPTYPPGIMKPDITFFGEKLTDDFDKYLAEDREKVDLLLVIGTSLKVSPVADILSHLPHSVPQILINKTPVRHINPDIVLLGNADEVVQHLCDELGWELPLPTAQIKSSRPRLPRGDSIKEDDIPQCPERVGNSHAWLFNGAEGGRWLLDLKKELERGEQYVHPPPGSGSSTGFSTPARGETPGRKRVFLDVSSEEERLMKKVKSEQDHTC